MDEKTAAFHQRLGRRFSEFNYKSRPTSGIGFKRWVLPGVWLDSCDMTNIDKEWLCFAFELEPDDENRAAVERFARRTLAANEALWIEKLQQKY